MSGPADLVLSGGDVRTMDARRPHAEAVAVRGGRIAAVGDWASVREYVKSGHTEVHDVGGHVVSPGFVDPHVHIEQGGISTEAFVRMGVTTVAAGQCGLSPDRLDGEGQDVATFLAGVDEGCPLSVAVYAGNIALRRAAGTTDPYAPATEAQVARMVELAAGAMDAGALGVSFGLEYEPGVAREELEALGRASAAPGGHIAAHIRVPDDPADMAGAVREIVGVGARVGCAVQLSHLTSMAGTSTPECLEVIAAARAAGQDVTTDVYPYTAWSTVLQSAVFDNPDAWDWTYDDIEVVTGPHAGRRCDRALFEELRAGSESTLVASHAIPAGAVAAALREPFTMVGSDGFFRWDKAQQARVGHPRGAGTFPRVIARYVREQRLLTLDDALFKMTALPAWRLRLSGKGVLAEGRDADITVFDPETVADTATFRPGESCLAPVGIDLVIVNGRVAVEDGRPTGALAGRALRRERGARTPMPVWPSEGRA